MCIRDRLWLALCYLVLTKAERIDGMTIVMLIIAAALVFIDVYKRQGYRMGVTLSHIQNLKKNFSMELTIIETSAY